MTREFDVYGVGNALVDVQYAVTPESLTGLGIDKGVMTLVDEERQREITSRLGAEPVKKASGGSAANTMIGVAQFGGTPYYACRLGRDAWGDFYQRDLEQAGVSTSTDNRGDGPTGQCLVMVTPDADRTLNTFLGISGELAAGQLEESVMAASKYVYLEGFGRWRRRLSSRPEVGAETQHCRFTHAQRPGHRRLLPRALRAPGRGRCRSALLQ